MSVGMSYEVNRNVKTLDPLFHDPASMDAAITTYKTTKTGPLSHSPVQAIAFLPSSVVSALPPDAPSLHALLKSHLDPTTASKTPTSLPSGPTQHRIITRHLLSPHSASATLSPHLPRRLSNTQNHSHNRISHPTAHALAPPLSRHRAHRLSLSAPTPKNRPSIPLPSTRPSPLRPPSHVPRTHRHYPAPLLPPKISARQHTPTNRP